MVAESGDLAALIDVVRRELGGLYAAREAGLAGCRRTIRAAGSAIRAVHRHQPERAAELVAESELSLREAQAAVAGYPTLAQGGFLHDAEKEYVEAVLTRALVDGSAIPDWVELGVGIPARPHPTCVATCWICSGGARWQRRSGCWGPWRIPTTCWWASISPTPSPPGCGGRPTRCGPCWNGPGAI